MVGNTAVWRPTKSDLFFSRKDALDIRLGEISRPLNPSAVDDVNNSTVIVGYADDEGIGLNGGRRGAKEGPEEIRRMLYRMTPPPSAQATLDLHDAGDVTDSGELADRHLCAQQLALTLLQRGNRVLSCGGGHDYAYADVSAFLKHFQGGARRPLVLNFDAHLDVRPTDRGLTSGTPFFRVLSEFNDFDLIEIGIQRQCNSQTHHQWLAQKNGVVVDLESLLLSGTSIMEALLVALGPYLERPRPTFISLDIDCFSTAFAPGCSQSWPLGLVPRDVFCVLQVLLERNPVWGMGIYEVSPPLDVAQMTSKLAAQLAYQFIFSPHPA